MLRNLLLVSLVTFSISSLKAQTTLTGHWTVAADYFGSRIYFPLDLEQQAPVAAATAATVAAAVRPEAMAPTVRPEEPAAP